MKKKNNYDFHDEYLIIEEKHEKKPMSILNRIMLFVAVATFLVSLIMLIKIGFQYYSARKEYSGARSEFVHSASSDNEKASADEDKAAYVDFASLQEINKDVVGWIDFVSEPEIISYPVVQGDDNSFYLTHSYTRAASGSASIFMDFNNSSDMTDLNTVIYGHNMNDRSMFAQLRNYVNSECQDYYDKNNEIYYYIPGANGNDIRYTYKIYSTYTINVTENEKAYNILNNDEQDDYQEWFETMKKRSVIEPDETGSSNVSDVDAGLTVSNKRLLSMLDYPRPTITLSTCTNASDEGRIIVQAVLTDAVLVDKDNNVIR